MVVPSAKPQKMVTRGTNQRWDGQKSEILFHMFHVKHLSNMPIKLGGTYNPSYSGGRDQDDHSSRPAREIV
jgi:hypothetical protein